MSQPLAILAAIAALAAIGATLRFLVSGYLNGLFPTGTLAVNLVASFTLGLISGLGSEWSMVVAAGGLGALSTWSTAANEVAAMARDEQGPLAAAYLACSVTAAVVLAWLGITVAAALGWR